MSIKAMNWAWAQEVKTSAKFVLMAMADHADDQGVCWPGQAGIAEKCGISRQSVNKNIRTLEEIGLVKKAFRGGKGGPQNPGGRQTCLYVLQMDSKSTNATLNTDFENIQSKVCDDSKSTLEGFKVKYVDTNRQESSRTVIKKKNTKKKKSTTAPDEFPITEQMIAWAKKKGITDISILEDQTEAFLVNRRKNGVTHSDWYAAWQEWMRRYLDPPEWLKQKNGTIKTRSEQYTDNLRRLWDETKTG